MKQHHLGSWKQLVAGLAIGTAFLAPTVAAATPSNVSLTYKAHSELTDAQKAQVNPVTPQRTNYPSSSRLHSGL
ncbi:TPA: hypothetical protein U0K67_002054 [Streptococcus suis]|nr:hypothetical protein [Streptococcus suis]